jgi:glycosyltransferase involved in cell wall biosynthesis
MQHILFFGTYDVNTTPRVQVLIEGLRAHGITVTECNVPLRLSTADRVKILQQPWRAPILAAHLLACWARLVLKRYRLPKVDAVIVGHLGQFDVRLARLLFRRLPIALDYMISGKDTANDRRLSRSGGLKSRLLSIIDNGALAAADIIIVDTEEHLENLPMDQRNKGVVTYVGAPEVWFSNAPHHHPASQARVVFFGAFTPLQGAPVIAGALKHLDASIHVTMIGSGQDEAEAKQLARSSKASVTWTSWVPAKELPSLVAEHDICLGIFGTGPKALRVVPNKVYQGAAAGCAIITSDTAPQRRVLGNNATYVTPGDPSALAAAINRLAHDQNALNNKQVSARKIADTSFRPAKVVTPLITKLQDAHA